MKGRGWYLLLNPKPVPQTQDRNTASVKAEQDTSITGLLEKACTRYVCIWRLSVQKSFGHVSWVLSVHMQAKTRYF